MSANRPIPKDFEGLLEPEEIHTLQNEFLDETAAELERVMNALAAAEQSEFDQDSVHQLFRVLHSMKGSASVFGYDDLSQLSHAVETALTPFRDLPAADMATHVDDMLFLAGLLLRLVQDGKDNRMDCSAAEKQLASWIADVENQFTSPQGDDRREQSGTSQANPGTVSPATRQQRTVLIADSARALHHMLHRFFEPYAVRWIDCASGAEVIERCVVESPSMLFLGYLLPDMNTAELLNLLHEAGIAPAAIVVISSRSEEELRRACSHPFTFIRKDHRLFNTLLPLVQSVVAE